MKPFMFIMAPVETRSGYGDHSRDLISSLIEMDMFDNLMNLCQDFFTRHLMLYDNYSGRITFSRRMFKKAGLVLLGVFYLASGQYFMLAFALHYL